MQMLRPGILVSLKTQISGGTLYERVPLEHETTDDGRDKAKWETTRYIEDPAEHERAGKTRSKARGLIERACSKTAFGLICPESKEAALDEAITEARKLTESFNDGAQHATIRVYVIRGRIASSDEEAARAIASEVRDLLAQMESGVRGVDVEKIRDAANRAKQLGAVLEESQAKKVNEAVEAARAAATAIVKRVVKGGELAETVIAELAGKTSAIEAARFSFLDIDDATVPAPAGDELPGVNVQRFTELEVDDELPYNTVEEAREAIANAPAVVGALLLAGQKDREAS